MEEVRAPWLRHYGNVPAHLDYPQGTLYDAVKRAADRYPDVRAYDFMGYKATYARLIEQIQRCARALRAIGVRPDDRVTICMPNTPQAVILFYAVNCVGALANMVHPLSGEEEIAFYLNLSKSTAVLTLDQFYPKFAAVRARTPALRTMILTSVRDMLPPLKKVGYALTAGRKVPRVPADADVLWWNDLLKKGDAYTGEYQCARGAEEPAAILYSGGTTGTTKGILLSNLNFNALGLQTIAAGDCVSVGHAMLAVMPMFHGFGLGVGIHTLLMCGGSCILVPQFNVKTYGKLLHKYRPNYIAGVPTLFEALLRSESVKDVDLSCLEGIFSGGDSLSIELKKKVDAFLQAHGSREQVREGYGTTECVTASCLTPRRFHKEGSIGIPFPDTYYKIVTPATHDEVPYGQVGEICISGPTVMLGYLDNPKETAQTLQLHEDGRVWLHTGDLGNMDEDGFIYFKQRLKRMIITSGYNVYPSQVENVIDSHEAVLMSTVIGVKDKYKMQRVKAFVVLKPGVEATEDLKEQLKAHCARYMARYAVPTEFEFRDSLPKTLVGKVAYTVLEKEEESRATTTC
ncbi:MAG: AMP-binding protein [Clostridia bacterium]|nr:AMP-binding protein [Clostridia bacterium]